MGSVVAALVQLPAPSAHGAAGDLDPAFGAGGHVTSSAFFDMGGGNPIALQTDGKILVAGYVLAADGRARFAIARFGGDGSPDPSFGGDGTVSTTFRTGETCEEVARSVLVQEDARILAVGTSSCERSAADASGRDAWFAVARYEPDGTPDATFGDEGAVLTSFGDPDRCNAQAVAAALTPGGEIVAGGTASCRKAGLDSRFAVARYTADGTLDTGFGGDGKVRTNLTSQFDHLTDVVVQPDGKLVAGGTAALWVVEIPDALESRAALVRYEPDGRLDATFGGGDGKVMTSFRSRTCPGSNESYGLAIQPDGKILEGGSAACAAAPDGVPHPRWALARYRPSGRLDRTFGRDGRVVTIFAEETATDWMYGGLAIQANGKIVAAGTAGRWNGRFTLARYRPSGRLDPRFGADGKVQSSFGAAPRCGRGLWDGLAIQPDGRTVVSGGGGCLSSFVMARYLPS